jgi:hypothetical protein
MPHKHEIAFGMIACYSTLFAAISTVKNGHRQALTSSCTAGEKSCAISHIAENISNLIIRAIEQLPDARLPCNGGWQASRRLDFLQSGFWIFLAADKQW